MSTFYKSFYRQLMSKVPGLSKRAERKNNHGQLPENLKLYLTKEFKLSPEDMANLRYTARSESLGLSAEKLIRIFDATKAAAKGIVVRKYSDLNRHPELVSFYGRIPKRGRISLKRGQGVTSFARRT